MSFKNLDVEGWESGLLGEKTDLLVGPAFQSHLFSEDSDAIRLLRGVNITRGTTRWGGDIEKKWKHVTHNLERYRLAIGDVVIGMDGALIGKNYAAVEQNDLPCLLVQRVARLRATDELDQRFLFHLISHPAFLRHIETYKTHTAIPHMSSADINNYPIPFPPPAEQRRITEILDTADEAIQKTEALIAKLKQMKAGLLYDLLTRGIDKNGELRIVADSNTQDVKDVGVFPNAWNIEPLSKYVSDWAVGPRFSSECYDTNGEIATLRTTDMDLNGNINLSTMPRAQLTNPQFKNHFLEVDDIVISRSGTIGITGVFQGHWLPVLPGAFLLRFRLNEHLHPQYLRAYLNSYAGAKRLQQLAAGGVQKNIRGTALLPMLIPVPKIDEQRLIVERLESLEQRSVRELNVLEKIQQLKSGLMHDLLTGKKRVKKLAAAAV